MSAQPKIVVEFPNSKRAPEARTLTKVRVLEHVRRLILEDQEERRLWKERTKGDEAACPATLTAVALNVAQYLSEITDKETGVTLVEKQTIADRIGRSKATVKRQLRRLIELGVIEREARRKGSRCYANAYRLVDPGSQMIPPRTTDDPTRGHQGPPYARGFVKPCPSVLNPHGLFHEREPTDKRSVGSRATVSAKGSIPPAAFGATGPPKSAQQGAQGTDFAHLSDALVQDFDWIDCGEWLAKKARLADYAPGSGMAYEFAEDYLYRWRERWGDQAVADTMNWAKACRGGRGLFGEFLMEQLIERLGEP